MKTPLSDQIPTSACSANLVRKVRESEELGLTDVDTLHGAKDTNRQTDTGTDTGMHTDTNRDTHVHGNRH